MSDSEVANANSSLPHTQTYQNMSVTNNGSYGRGSSHGEPSASNFSYGGLCSPAQWYNVPVYSNWHQRSGASSTSYGSNPSSAKNQSLNNNKPHGVLLQALKFPCNCDAELCLVISVHNYLSYTTL